MTQIDTDRVFTNEAVPVLSWEKPKPARSHRDHVALNSSDCGVPGTYQPNMSQEDRLRWKAKLVGKRRKRLQVEIRRNSTVIIVGGPDGYMYKRYDNTTPWAIHIATAGALVLSAQDWADLQRAVMEARMALGREMRP